MKPILLCLIVLMNIATVGLAQSDVRWRHQYLPARSADEISVCTATVGYSNARFTARLYGEQFDMLYRRDDFTLPYGRDFGGVLFVFGSDSFLVNASTNERKESDRHSTSQLLFLAPSMEDYGMLFEAFRSRRSFAIVFPNGDTYEFPLAGSARAFSETSTCWLNNETGEHVNNPFSTQDNGAGNNPF